MTGVLLCVALALAIGFPLARLLDASSGAGESLLLGIAAEAFVLFALAIAGVAWTLPSFAVTTAALIAIAWLALFRSGRARITTPQRRPFAALAMMAAAVVLLAGYWRFATIAVPWEFDYLGDWGLKGRVFWEARSIDWHFLEQAFHRAVHADYPVLLPLSFDVVALLNGSWPDRWIGALNVIFAAGLLLIVERLAREELRNTTASAFVALAVFPFAATPWIGIGEGPLVAYGTAALLLIRRAIQADDTAAFAAGAVMLGLAASVKNEGLTLIAGAAVGLVIARRWKDLPRLWPALVIPAPWLLLRSIHHLGTDLTTGSPLARVLQHLGHPSELVDALARYPVGKPLYWAALLAAVVIAWRPLLTRERFVITTCIVQFAFYVGAYLATPWDVDWHVRWSWERLVSHLTPVLTVVVLLQLLATFVEQRPRPSPAD